MIEQALEWLAIYGLPFFFLILTASAAGIPFPVTVTILLVGSMVEQGEVGFWGAFATGSMGAIAGDQIGYFLGRIGGRKAIDLITDRFGGASKFERAERLSKRWGAPGIFFSRWLITPLGPWINLASGTAGYSWPAFTVFGAMGELIWVLLYLSMGIYFSGRVQATAEFVSSLNWTFVGIAVTVLLGWMLFRGRRKRNAGEKAVKDTQTLQV